MRTLLTILLIVTGMVMEAQYISVFVHRQMHTYPQSRLIDIYKSCFQDQMGAEHLVADRQRAKEFLEQELATASADDLMSWYVEPCGIQGNFVRISLRAVIEGYISAEILLDAFVRSANTDRPTIEAWRQRWHEIVAVVDSMQLDLPQYAQDCEMIEQVLASGKYAISHSPEYRQAYHPHYRIVSKEIYENELKLLLNR